MELKELFNEELILHLDVSDQRQLFEVVARHLESKNVVKDTYFEALVEREKSFPTGLDMAFLGKELPNVAIPHTDVTHCLTENVVVVKLANPVTFHNMISPDSEVEVSILFFIINNSSTSQTNILAQLMDFFTKGDNLGVLSSLSDEKAIYQFLVERTGV